MVTNQKMDKIIDIHTHAFPDELATRAVSLLEVQGDIKAHLNGTVRAIKDSMIEAGIAISVIQPVATKPSQVRSINQWAKQITDEKIISFGALHPDQQTWQEEIDWLKENGIPGIKLHPDYQKFQVDEDRMMPIYEAIFKAGLIILFHAGVDIGLPAPYGCTPARLSRVIDAFPEAKIIAAHMGGYDCWDEVEKYILGKNILLDTSYSIEHMGAERMLKMIRAHGAEKILFGTDSPWEGQKDQIRALKRLPLSTLEKSLILSENAIKLLGFSSNIPI